MDTRCVIERVSISRENRGPKVKIVRWPHADFCCWNSGRIKRGENGAELVPKGKAKRFQQVLFEVLLPPIVVLGAPLAKLQEQPVVEERLLEPERIQPGRLLASKAARVGNAAQSLAADVYSPLPRAGGEKTEALERSKLSEID